MKSESVGCEHHFERLKRPGSPGLLGASPCTAYINSWKVLIARSGRSIAIEDPTRENRQL